MLVMMSPKVIKAINDAYFAENCMYFETKEKALLPDKDDKA